MIYLFLFLAAMAIVIFKLGALSIWLTVLSAALIVVTVIVVAIVVAAASYAAWKRYRTCTTRIKTLPKL